MRKRYWISSLFTLAAIAVVSTALLLGKPMGQTHAAPDTICTLGGTEVPGVNEEQKSDYADVSVHLCQLASNQFYTH